jgi:hypothetical protein
MVESFLPVSWSWWTAVPAACTTIARRKTSRRVAFISWVAPNIPRIINAVEQISAAILVFIGETAGVLLNHIQQSWSPAFANWTRDALPKLIAALGTMLTNMQTTVNGWGTALHPALAQAV